LFLVPVVKGLWKH